MELSRTDRLPTGAAPFTQLLRGPRFRWWRPFLSLLLFVVFGTVLLAIISGLAYGLAVAAPLTFGSALGADLSDPAAMTYGNLTLAALLPAAVGASWIAHRIPPGYQFSVAGRLRWRWLARCLLALLPVFAV